MRRSISSARSCKPKPRPATGAMAPRSRLHIAIWRQRLRLSALVAASAIGSLQQWCERAHSLQCRQLEASEKFRARVLRADAAADAVAFDTLQATHRGACSREQEIRAERADSKAEFDAVMTQQMDDMTRLTGTWHAAHAEVAAAEAELETSRIERVKAERDHADYFRSQDKQCAPISAPSAHLW